MTTFMPLARIDIGAELDAYARDVVAGVIPAGRYHRAACERHLRDRDREGSDDFPFVFNAAKAVRFFRFTRKCRHYKGEWAGHRIRLQPYQRFRLGSLFGWVHRDTGLRRFRTSYSEIPRKNGKSLEAALVALYVTFYDGEQGAEGYCAATKRDQAKIVFGDARRLVLRSAMRKQIRVLERNLHREDRAAKLEPLGADYDSTDGLNPNLIVLDEFHALKVRAMVDVLETATGARQQPVMFQITTAGNDMVSPCGDQHEYACRVLDGVIVDESFFAFIAHADEGDDWLDPLTWQKANPNYGVSVNPDDLMAKAAKARNMPSAAAAFQQKHLNLWVNRDSPWLSMEGWRAGQSHWVAADMRDQPCYVGIDLSSKTDLTAIVFAFPPDDTRERWRYFGIGLTPFDTLADRATQDRVPYQHWADLGVLRTNPGKRIDYAVVRQIINEFDELFDVQEVGYDPWNAGNLPTDLSADGFTVTEVPMTYAQLSPAAKDFEADVLQGLVDAGGNPLMSWHAGNVVVTRDTKDNIFPTKKRSRGRIDLMVAAIIARKIATAPPDDTSVSAYADGHGVELV